MKVSNTCFQVSLFIKMLLNSICQNIYFGQSNCAAIIKFSPKKIHKFYPKKIVFHFHAAHTSTHTVFPVFDNRCHPFLFSSLYTYIYSTGHVGMVSNRSSRNDTWSCLYRTVSRVDISSVFNESERTSACRKKLHKSIIPTGYGEDVETSVQSLNRATGIHISFNNKLQPISVQAIIRQEPESSTGTMQLLANVAASKFLITRSCGSRYRCATARPPIYNFSTMQRGASWPSNLNLRLAR